MGKCSCPEILKYPNVQHPESAVSVIQLVKSDMKLELKYFHQLLYSSRTTIDTETIVSGGS